MNYMNLTPHLIALNDGRQFPASGHTARVSTTFTEFKDDVCSVVYGEVENLPKPYPNTMYIVSAMVLSALNGSRSDVVAPATGHPAALRNDKGQIVSVPGFVR